MSLHLQTDYSTLHKTLMAEAKKAGVYGTGIDRGVCFRVSFKWLVTTWKGQAFKGAQMNMAKAGQKQMDYLKQADAVDKSQYATWFKNANTLSKTTMQDWGSKHGMTCAEPYTCPTLTSAQPLAGNPDAAMIVGFFGEKSTGVWGHATAYCNRGNKPLFFDINYGVYSFDGGDDPAAVMQKFITDTYCKDKTIKDFALYQMI